MKQVKLEELPRETLIELARMYARNWQTLDGLWFQNVEARYGLEAAEAKMQAFIEMLGNDAKLLTEGEEIKSHDLFTRLTSRKTITGEDETEESELKYLKAIRGIRDNEPGLFQKIKRLPKKARTGRTSESGDTTLLTYFRKGKLQKFYLANDQSTQELDFLSAARQLEVDKDTQRQSIP